MAMTEPNVSISSRIDKLIAVHCDMAANSFTDETPLGETEIDADSLGLVEIAEIIGVEMDVCVPNEALDTFETVGGIRDYVKDHDT